MKIKSFIIGIILAGFIASFTQEKQIQNGTELQYYEQINIC